MLYVVLHLPSTLEQGEGGGEGGVLTSECKGRYCFCVYQSPEKAKEYFVRKVEFITKQMEKIQPLLQDKYRTKQGESCFSLSTFFTSSLSGKRLTDTSACSVFYTI